MSERLARGLSAAALACLGLLLALSSVAANSYATYRKAIAPARANTPDVPTAADATGYPVPCYYIDFDAYYYVTFARRMVRDATLRVRWTNLDNVPDGRAVHWSSLFSWWLIALAAAHSLFSGVPVAQGVLAAGYYANPLLLGLLLTVLAGLAFRATGGLAALVLLVALATHSEVLWDFEYARADHHGLGFACALGMLVCAVLGGGGWVDQQADARQVPPPKRQARRWLIASGILGGCGLWIGAAQQSVAIFSLAVGAALAALLFAGPQRGPHDDGTAPAAFYEPQLWRWWCWAGAATSILAYLVEYAPGHMAMRLEVNHPLYALAWLCGGELLYRLGRWRAARSSWTARETAQAALLVAGMLPLVALVLVGPVKWYLVRDPYMLRLHAGLDEFEPFLSVASLMPLPEVVALSGVLLFSLAAGVTALAIGGWSRPHQALVVLALVPTAVAMGWTLFQWRWITFATGAALCLLLVLFLLKAHVPAGRAALTNLASVLLLALVALQGVIHAGKCYRYISEEPRLQPVSETASDVPMRDLAVRLAEKVPVGPAHILSSLALSARMHFFGPFRVVGTPYWENVAGLHATADFFADYGDAEARRIAHERRIDWVIVPNDPYFCAQMHFVKHGNEFPKFVEQTLAFRLLSGERVPQWLEPVPLAGISSDFFHVYRVRQPPSE